MLLFFILGACKNGSDSSVAFTSTEDEYQAVSDLLIDKELRIYGPGVSPQERNRFLLELTQERIRLVCHHAPTSPSALDDMVRSSSIIPRQKILEVYKSLTPGMQKTYLGKAIKKHVKKKKVLVGDALPHFEGVGLNGEPFDWSVTDGKRVLLIYEGWGWIKRSTHFWFKDLLAATDRDSLVIVTYVYSNSLSELRKRVKAFQLDPYYVISDLKGTEGPLDRKLGIHGIPTYYYTDREGHVRRILGGFDEQLFTSLTGLSPKWGENWTEEIGKQ